MKKAAILAIAILVFILSTWLAGCNTVHKLFNKKKSQVDSVSVVHERKDSIAEHDTFAVRKQRTEDSKETVINWGDAPIYVPFKDSGINDGGIYIYHKNPDDYFFFDAEKRTIVSNRVPSKVIIKENSRKENYDSLLGHSKIEKSEVKDDSTKVQKKEKIVTKEVRKKRTWLWWLLLLIPAYIIYRNWPKIRAFLVHWITGL